MNNRKSILAGSWYSDNPNELRASVEKYINDADIEIPKERVLGIISPHAGHIYSGPVMGYGYKVLREQAKTYDIKNIIIIAFSHRGIGDGKISVWNQGYWETPLGKIEINTEIANALIESSPIIDFVPETHESEHSLEIQLPFLQMALKDFRIVPVSFSHMSMTETEELINSLAKVLNNRDDVFIIASTDMSHYHTYSQAVKMDREALEYIIDNNANDLIDALSKRNIELCGWGTVLTLMKLSNIFGAENITMLNYANSGDVTGDTSQVVGYGSVAFSFPGTFEGIKYSENDDIPGTDDYDLTREEKIYLLQLARQSIDEYVKNRRRLQPEKPKDKKLTKNAAVFVTLNKDGSLRGCIGQMVAQAPIYKAVRDMAISASSNDYRFQPVKTNELDKIDIEISVLSPMKKIDSYKDVRLGIDGVYIIGHHNGGTRTGVFLPSVATDTGWSLDEFLGELCSQKANLPREFYKHPDAEIFTFTVLKFSEKDLMTK